MFKATLRNCVLAALVAAAPAALAQDAYVIGLSGAVTGRGSDTYAPVVDALKIYFDQVNAKGGINGKPVRLVIQDNQSEPSKAAADVKKLLSQDKALVVLNTSLSSTYAPMISETKRAGVPIFFAGSVCPTEVYPKADPLQFCSTAFGARYDSRFAMDFVKKTAKGPVKIGFSAMAIPISRGEIDYAEGLAKEMGMQPVGKEVIPPPTADYTPFATKIKDSGANWVYSWAPWVTQVKTFEALRRLGWDGNYIAFAHINAEDELPRIKDDKFYVFGANALFSDGTPIHRAIQATVGKAGSKYPVTQMAEGWVAAMTLERALAAAGWPATPEKVAKAMSALSVDTNGLRGGALQWTPANHFRTTQYYRVYRWNSAKNGIEVAQDWTAVPVK